MELPFILFAFHESMSPEQKCGTPDACKTHKGIYQTAEQGALTAEQPGDEIKLKDADQTPVQTSHYRKNQCDGIHTKNLLFFWMRLVYPRIIQSISFHGLKKMYLSDII